MYIYNYVYEKEPANARGLPAPPPAIRGAGYCWQEKNESDLVIGRTGCGGRCDWYKIIYNQEEAGVS